MIYSSSKANDTMRLLSVSAAAWSVCGLFIFPSSSAFAPVSQHLARPRGIIFPLHASPRRDEQSNPVNNFLSFMNKGKKEQEERRAAAERAARVSQNYYKYNTLDQEMNYPTNTPPPPPTTTMNRALQTPPPTMNRARMPPPKPQITNRARMPYEPQKPFYKYASYSQIDSFPRQPNQPREQRRPNTGTIQRQLRNQRFETVDQRNQRLNLGFPINKRRSNRHEEEERARRVAENYYKYASYSLLDSQPRQPREY